MPLNIPGNFVSSRLRAAMLSTDVVMQVSPGTGVKFDVTAGDFFWVVISNQGLFEVVLHGSTGPIGGDNIQVVRGQESTLARNWPIGSCVEVAWTKGQLQAFIDARIISLLPTLPLPPNTVHSTTPPVAPPLYPNTLFWVDTATLTLYYWTGTGWIPIVGGGGGGSVIQVSPLPPAGPPATGTFFAYDTATATLYVWDSTGVVWVAVNAHRTLGVSVHRVANPTVSLDTYGHVISPVGGYHSFTRYLNNNVIQVIAPGSGYVPIIFSNNDAHKIDDTHPANIFSADGATGIIVNTDQCIIRLHAQVNLTIPVANIAVASSFRTDIMKDPIPTRVALNSLFTSMAHYVPNVNGLPHPAMNISSPPFIPTIGDIFRLIVISDASNTYSVYPEDTSGGALTNFGDCYLSAEVVGWL